jgi:hypothetical protein
MVYQPGWLFAAHSDLTAQNEPLRLSENESWCPQVDSVPGLVWFRAVDTPAEKADAFC